MLFSGLTWARVALLLTARSCRVLTSDQPQPESCPCLLSPDREQFVSLHTSQYLALTFRKKDLSDTAPQQDSGHTRLTLSSLFRHHPDSPPCTDQPWEVLIWSHGWCISVACLLLSIARDWLCYYLLLWYYQGNDNKNFCRRRLTKTKIITWNETRTVLRLHSAKCCLVIWIKLIHDECTGYIICSFLFQILFSFWKTMRPEWRRGLHQADRN